MSEPKYKKVDKLIHGEVKEIHLIGESEKKDNEMYYFVFWHNHIDKPFFTVVGHKDLFECFKIDQEEFDKKYKSLSELEK